MPIRASSARSIDALLADLDSEQATTREAAVARLTVFGARAVDRLVVLVGVTASPLPRALALRALEAIGDPRALDRILDAIADEDPHVALAATSATKAFLRGPRGAAVVDRLTTIAMDATRSDALRVEALQVLQQLEPSTIAPLLKSLEHDPSKAIQAATQLNAPATTAEEYVAGAADGPLPESPQELAAAVTRGGHAVTVPILLHLIERVREHEATLPVGHRPAWTLVRGRAHLELARRGSRVALYDLRESLETADAPLPVDFLAALAEAGDASCLEAVAKAYERTTAAAAAQGDWWREHLAEAFRAIVVREGITRRHSIIKKLEKRMKSVVDALLSKQH